MHFYNLSLAEVYRLKVDEYHMLWQAITMIESQQMLMDMEVMNCVELSKSKKTVGKSNKIHRKLWRDAFPPAFQNTISVEEFVAMIGDQSG